MQINTIKSYHSNTTSFGAILPSQKTKQVLFERIRKPEWSLQYKNFIELQENNPVDIILNVGNINRLEAVFKGPDGLIMKEKENYISSLLNLNPIKFIKKVCKTANELCVKYYK